MRKWLLLFCLASLMVGVGPPPVAARQAPTCERLWYNRTAIYARRGKCFKDERALKVFGQRCFSPYGKLTFRDQRRVNNIARQERRMGCTTN
jgi:YARHG domain